MPKKDIDTILLQKKVPLQPELEKLLLSFHKIEQTSGSRIDEVDFQYDGNVSEFDLGQEEESGENQENHKETQENHKEIQENHEASQENSTVPENADESPDNSKPEKLQLITAKLSVLAPDHEHFMKFIKEIEALEMVTRVDRLEFDLPGEKELKFQDSPNEAIAFTIHVTTFYYEK